MRSRPWLLVCACPAALVAGVLVIQRATLRADDVPGSAHSKPAQKTTAEDQADVPARGVAKAWTTAVDPKPLSANAKKGLAWLAEHQLPSGGWGQGEESPNMRGAGGETLRDQANVADTCIAALALIRSGNTPTHGQYKDSVARAVRFVMGQVEQSDSQSLSVSSVQGTRVQAKLGPNIDTFLASLLLAEVKDQMPTANDAGRAGLALDRVLDKIKRHQKADGSFDGAGWAPILAQAMCGKALNRARQNGAHVPEMVLARAENSAKMAFAQTAPALGGAGSSPAVGIGGAKAGGFSAATASSPARAAAPAAAAGVELYDRAASLGVLQDSVNTNRSIVSELRTKATESKDLKEREAAKGELARIDDAEKVYKNAQKAVIDRLGDKQFTDGFGSNGGEEFLSYMNISESLVVKGGNAWRQWDATITGNLNHVQNDDGSWSGHHCITGRTFCTSSALLVLLADRTPVPADAKNAPHVGEE